jgi:hypothetical protein
MYLVRVECCNLNKNNNNYIIYELYISIANISNKPYQCRNTDYWAEDTIGD